MEAIAPDLRGLFTDLGPLIKVSGKGLPALDGILDDSRPLLARFEPYLRTLQPTFDYLGLYKREITALLGNAAGTTQAVDPGTNTSRLIHYLRTTNPISPEVLATYEKRLPSNRSNPYPEPGAYSQLARGLPTFGSYLCANPGPGHLPGAARAQPAADRQPAPPGREVRLHPVRGRSRPPAASRPTWAGWSARRAGSLSCGPSSPVIPAP